VPPSTPPPVNALVYTGATTTSIADGLATRLNLQPVGKMAVQGVGGVKHHNSYLFMVGFPFAIASMPGSPPPAPGQIPMQIFILGKVIYGCEFAGGQNPPFEVLLGMDVISWTIS
jgi:hypothetical protein